MKYLTKNYLTKFLCLVCICLLSSCASIDYVQLGQAALGFGKAATISEEELQKTSMQFRMQSDQEATVATGQNKYAKRLNKLVKKHTEVNGIALNYKVYLSKTVNANSTPDGSIRFYSGLMDLMTDPEIRFVLGHEIGHIALGHSMSRMRTAYIASATRTAAGALSPLANLGSSVIGSIGEKFVNSQFSQSNELEADAYAVNFLKQYGYDLKAAMSAIKKLESVGGEGGGFLSSHPSNPERYEKLVKLTNQ